MSRAFLKGSTLASQGKERGRGDMNEKELLDTRLKEFADLQRIKRAADRDAEIAYQEKFLKAQLQSLGVHTEDLEEK